jgi:hypothetical protein
MQYLDGILFAIYRVNKKKKKKKKRKRKKEK